MSRHGRIGWLEIAAFLALGAGAVAACLGAALDWPSWRVAAAVVACASAGAGVLGWWWLRTGRAGTSPGRAGGAPGGTPDGAARAGAESGRSLISVLNGVDEPVIVTGSSGAVVLCNAPAAALIGIPAERIVGRALEEVFTSEELLELYARGARGLIARGRVRLARPEGTRVYESSAVPLAGAAGGEGRPGVVMTLRDVTELSLAVQVKADFVANASHELRTPIASLKAAAETLSGGAMDDPPMRERLVRMMAENIDRLEEMVRDLLDLSRLESPDIRVRKGPVPASRLREMLSVDFEKVCREKRLTLEFDLDPSLEGLRTDAGLLGMILKNLIDNATKFAYEGTGVLVTGRPVAAGGAEPTGGAVRGVRFEVTDRGMGIPLAQQGRIFERYYQVDPARSGTAQRRGTGLGLAIVKHAVRTLGGTVRVRSVWKQGTTMTVDLPDAFGAANGAGTDGSEEPLGDQRMGA